MDHQALDLKTSELSLLALWTLYFPYSWIKKAYWEYACVFSTGYGYIHDLQDFILQ